MPWLSQRSSNRTLDASVIQRGRNWVHGHQLDSHHNENHNFGKSWINMWFCVFFQFRDCALQARWETGKLLGTNKAWNGIFLAFDRWWLFRYQTRSAKNRLIIRTLLYFERNDFKTSPLIVNTSFPVPTWGPLHEPINFRGHSRFDKIFPFTSSTLNLMKQRWKYASMKFSQLSETIHPFILYAMILDDHGTENFEKSMWHSMYLAKTLILK